MMVIEERIKAIYDDRSRGASELTRQALDTLKLAAATLPASPPDQYLTALTGVALELSRVRPNMHSIKYYMQCFLAEAQQYKPGDDLPLCMIKLTDKLVQLWRESKTQVSKAGASLIEHGNTIFSGSYSSTVISSLITARNEGKNFKLFIALSRQTSQPAYGQHMAGKLAEQGIACILIEDTDVANYLGKSDLVLLGADTILADGSVVNGYPSLAIAQAAKINAVPVYVLGEPSKYSDQLAIRPEPGFDLIPSELIFAVITA